MKETLRALSVVVSLCLAVGPAVQAQTPAETKQARKAYARGHEQFRQGDYEAAMASFQEAYDTVPNPIVLISIAEAQQRLGLWAEAEKTLETYLEERPDAPDRPQVEQQLESIRARPGTLRVESTPPGAVIVLDGADTGEITPAELSLEPGPHQLTLHGVTGVEKQGAVNIEVGGRHLLEVDLQLPPEAQAEAAAAKAQEQEEAAQQVAAQRQRVRRAAWSSLGVGLSGALVGSVLGGFALKQRNEFDGDPTAGTADKGERLAIFADVSFGIAAAGILTAVVLLTTEKKGGESEEPVAGTGERPRATLTPVFGPSGGGLSTQVRF